MLIIGHRGAAGVEPENTLRSIEAAILQGAAFIELDVYLVEDQLVVFHDEYLERTTNGKGRLKDQTLAGLRSLDAGKGEKIPLLSEVFDLVNRRVGINIEIKDSEATSLVAAFVLDMFAQGWTKEEIIVSSFDHQILERISRQSSDISIGVLLYGIPIDLAEIGSRLRAYSIHPSSDYINEVLVEDAHRRGLRVFVYTVNTARELTRVANLKADGIFSDLPGEMALVLRDQMS